MAFRLTRGKLMRQVKAEGWEVDWRDARGPAQQHTCKSYLPMSSRVQILLPSFRSLHIAKSPFLFPLPFFLRARVLNLAACSSLIPRRAAQKKTLDTMSRGGWRE